MTWGKPFSPAAAAAASADVGDALVDGRLGHVMGGHVMGGHAVVTRQDDGDAGPRAVVEVAVDGGVESGGDGDGRELPEARGLEPRRQLVHSLPPVVPLQPLSSCCRPSLPCAAPAAG